MKKTKPPVQSNYNLRYGYSDDLLEVPENPESMIDYCKDCIFWINEEMQKPENEWDVQLLVTQMGNVAAFLKMLRELDDALEFIETALSLIEQHDLGLRQFVAQSLRWADILRYMGEVEEAEEIFNSVIEICDENEDVKVYKDVALQHIGKLHFDIGEYKEALQFFEQALSIRKIKKDPSLIASSEMAIEANMMKIEEVLR
jgi:tetratricopeptide (TPR) repeat protein